MRTPPRLLAVLLGVLLVAVGAAYVVIGDDEPATASGPPPVLAASGETYVGGSLPGSGADPVAVAVEVLPLALGYDYRKLAEGARRRDRPDDRRLRRRLQPYLPRLRRPAGAHPEGRHPAPPCARPVSSTIDDVRALCLVYVDQALVSSTTLENAEAPVRVSQNRVLVGLVRVDDAWRVQSIEPF